MSWDDTSVEGVRSNMPSNRQVRCAHAGGKGRTELQTREREVRPKVTTERASASELRCLFRGAEFLFGGFVCQLRDGLRESPSPVCESSSSSNYILFSSLLFFVLCLPAFLFLFWLGYAVDHRPHTPLSTPFHIAPWSPMKRSSRCGQ